MSLPEAPPAEQPTRGITSPGSSAASLPAVAPPTGTFILQLFLIPLLIVSIVIVLWLLFSWVAHMGRDNAASLADAIIRDDTASWQRAYELADLLRSPDPKYAALKDDAELAKTLATFLERDLKEPLAPVTAVAIGGGGSTYSGSQAKSWCTNGVPIMPTSAAHRPQRMRMRANTHRAPSRTTLTVLGISRIQ